MPPIRLLRALLTASNGERFLRAGFPRSETLLLLAIKMHDYEAALPALRAGRTVIEGRSIHSIAVYQSLIMNPDDDHAAYVLAGQILDGTARWRPLPAAPLFERLAAADPEHIRLLDRREHDTHALVDSITAWIANAPSRPFHGLVPAAVVP